MMEGLDILAIDGLKALIAIMQQHPRPVRVFCSAAGYFSERVNNAYNAELGGDPDAVRGNTAELMACVRALNQTYRPPVNRELFPEDAYAKVQSVLVASKEMLAFAAQPQYRGAVFRKGFTLLEHAYDLVRHTPADSSPLSDVMYRLRTLLNPISPAQEIPEDWE